MSLAPPRESCLPPTCAPSKNKRCYNNNRTISTMAEDNDSSNNNNNNNDTKELTIGDWTAYQDDGQTYYHVSSLLVHNISFL